MAQTFKFTVLGDTKPAVAANEALDASINKVDVSTQKLDASTKKLGADTQKAGLDAQKAFGAQLETKIKASDAKIKTITGTIGLFSGALSTVVGTLGVFGIDDEQIAGFQKATLSVLALGQGVASSITGFKDLTEARKLQNEVTAASIVAENANTSALASQAAAAGSVTIAIGNATTSITAETITTEANTIAKAGNISTDELLFQTRNKLALQGIRVTEAQVAQTLGTEADTAAKAANTVATEALTVGTAKLTIAQRALNLVAKANPYIAVASIIFAVGSAIFALTRNTDDNTSASNKNSGAVKTNNELRKEQLQTLKDVNREYLDSNERLEALEAGAKARGISVLAEAKAEKARAKEAIERADNELALIREGNSLGRTTLEGTKDQIEAVKIRKDEAQKYYDSVVEGEKLYLETTKKTNEENAKRKKELRDQRLETEGNIQVIKLLGDEFIASLDKVEKFFDGAKYAGQRFKIEPIDLLDLEDFKFLGEEQLTILKRLRGELNGELKQQLFAREQQYNDEIALFTDNEEYKTQLTEEYEKDRNKIRLQYAAELAGQVLSTTNTLLSELGNLQQEAIDIELDKLERKYQRDLELAGENTKLKESLTRGFEARELEIQKKALAQQKALRTAQVATTTAESVINAFNSTSTLPPPFNFIAGSALAAAYTLLGVKAIKNINAVSLDGGGLGTGGFNNIPGGGGFSLPGGGGVSTSPSLGAVLPGIGGGRLATPSIGTIGQEPIRAYVLTGDISNGVQAGIALNNRRRLSGG
jgi:hypothetical protein